MFEACITKKNNFQSLETKTALKLDVIMDLTEKNSKGQSTFDEGPGPEKNGGDEQLTKEVQHKGGLISEGILTLVPLPIKGVNSLSWAKNSHHKV